MIKYFENGDKEHLKKVLRKVYKCKNVEQMSDDELVFCYIAKTLKSLEDFCEIVESAETELNSRILKIEKALFALAEGAETELNARISKIEKALKYAHNFDEFKSFCLEGCDE